MRKGTDGYTGIIRCRLFEWGLYLWSPIQGNSLNCSIFSKKYSDWRLEYRERKKRQATCLPTFYWCYKIWYLSIRFWWSANQLKFTRKPNELSGRYPGRYSGMTPLNMGVTSWVPKNGRISLILFYKNILICIFEGSDRGRSMYHYLPQISVLREMNCSWTLYAPSFSEILGCF